MKQLLTIALLTMVGCGLPAVAHAQPKKGDKEVQISGNMFTELQNGSSNTSGDINFGIGFYATDRLEIGVQPSIRIAQGTLTVAVPSNGLSEDLRCQ